jgi:hypothetical protein
MADLDSAILGLLRRATTNWAPLGIAKVLLALLEKMAAGGAADTSPGPGRLTS